MRIAVVSGANRGIGLAIVKELASRFAGLVYLTGKQVSQVIVNRQKSDTCSI